MHGASTRAGRGRNNRTETPSCTTSPAGQLEGPEGAEGPHRRRAHAPGPETAPGRRCLDHGGYPYRPREPHRHPRRYRGRKGELCRARPGPVRNGRKDREGHDQPQTAGRCARPHPGRDQTDGADHEERRAQERPAQDHRCLRADASPDLRRRARVREDRGHEPEVRHQHQLDRAERRGNVQLLPARRNDVALHGQARRALEAGQVPARRPGPPSGDDNFKDARENAQGGTLSTASRRPSS